MEMNRTMDFIPRIPALLVCLCLLPGSVVAQSRDVLKVAPKDTSRDLSRTGANTSAPVAAVPERTAASFGDWVLRCEAVVVPAKRICEVAQVITPQGQSNPVAQLALGRLAVNEPSRLTVMLAPNVAILAKPQVTVAKSGGTSVELSWQSCTPGGCFATAGVVDDTIAAFSAQTEPGRILFKDAGGREVVLPLSFRGLAQALAALAKEI